MSRGIPALALAIALFTAAPATAAESLVKVKGWDDAPGPSKYDKIDTLRMGPSSAKTVLVLVPGTSGGAGNFRLLGRELVERVPGVQVWAMDRRSQQLEDTSVFAKKDGKAYFDFYLGGLTTGTGYKPPDTKTLGFAKDWGLEVQLEDLRQVVKAAAKGGRRVVLGGHSLGASVALAYASWDFDGEPGHEDLAGIMLLDGGLLGSFDSVSSKADARKQLADIDEEQPFSDLLGLKLPWAAGVFVETAAQNATTAPTGPSVFTDFALLPPQFKPPVPATNRGALGYALDASTSPKALSLIHVRAGAFGPDGDWVNGEVSPIERVAEMFGTEPANGVEWFFPRRLSLDVNAASPLKQTGAAKELGLRLEHAGDAKLPTYALQTSLTSGRVLAGARRWGQRSGSKVTSIDVSSTQSHLDPLTASPAANKALPGLVSWLEARAR